MYILASDVIIYNLKISKLSQCFKNKKKEITLAVSKSILFNSEFTIIVKVKYPICFRKIHRGFFFKDFCDNYKC